jgi:exonuclease SbcC
MDAQAKLNQEREIVGFHPELLAVAQRLELEARETADNLRETVSNAVHEAREARSARERLASEAEALHRLLDEADEHEREADELTRMYEEFREFDRYVARQVGPLLAESTERMLGHVTNGKFDQVQFDENYGIEIFDGDQPFPMSSFSGGERDVVALCARLALSEIVGSAALRPPRFLVLDEVFGSLDSDRRAQLLEMLGGLAASGYFRQMFIVSHVDDVQQSPVMTEAWRIEDNDGVSRVVKPSAIAA